MEPSYLEFLVVPKVYEVVSSYEAKVEHAEDMVSWLQNNPNLDAENPEPMTIGGVKGAHSMRSLPAYRRSISLGVTMALTPTT